MKEPPTTEPTTIPAIAPPESLLPLLPVDDDEGDEDAELVDVAVAPTARELVTAVGLSMETLKHGTAVVKSVSGT